MKTMNEKLEGLIKNKPSGWLKKAKFRKENRKWLGYSSNIALRAFTAIEDIEGMNQKTLAEKLGVKPQYISKLLKGEQNLSLQTIGKLSEALGVELISFPEYKYSQPLLGVQNELENFAINDKANSAYQSFQINAVGFIDEENKLNFSSVTVFTSTNAQNPNEKLLSKLQLEIEAAGNTQYAMAG